MSIFAPQNVMGPAHRGGVIQQLAQGAAQNVMRRQKLKALLQNSAGQAASRSIGGGVAFRGSMQGHATGVRGAVQRPAQFSGGTGQSLAQMQGGMSLPDQTNPLTQPDPGTPDLPSLPDSADPSQSQGSTQQPVGTYDPATNQTIIGYGTGGAPLYAPGQSNPDGSYNQTTAAGNSQPYGGWVQNANGTFSAGSDVAQPQAAPVGALSAGKIPLGGGMYYDPATDAVSGGGGRRPGAQM